MKNFRSIKGTHDILPEDSYKWRHLESIVHQVCAQFGYQEIRTPIFEQNKLFSRSVGEESDIVTKEMYSWEDKENSFLTLRPELTAPVARAYNQHNLGNLSPIHRFYYIGPLFRRERPQKGRQRQFHQFGIEAFGSNFAEQDAEIIALAWHLLAHFRLTNKIDLQVNSIGTSECRAGYRDALKQFLKPHFDELSEISKRRFNTNPLRILDSKNKKEQTILKNGPRISDYYTKDDKEHFNEVKTYLKAMNIPFTINSGLVRGLDYYTKTVFEIISNELGSQDALLGGGRYDSLVETLGGKPTPGIGFAAGIERILLLINEENFKEHKPVPDIYLICLEKKGIPVSLNIAKILRLKGLNIVSDPLRRSMKAQMRDANKLRARYVLILGESELNDNTIILKNLESGKQESIKQEKIVKYFDNLTN
ncbi:MAG: histidine--tRNA ligase [Candidatus Neomarinimicrobiota bacterium]|nr:MAG: histidine--tRNA ligase [Candidatus Neomarinimicrobiota bacterium]